ncbi:MAG TPA: zf-TFIIB domain-containing protein [Candidatus Nanoarchaeia archaeon]|nr:zf-TFIIB domain-containing protein [Candidatus Nanoarchaeia archaeon]
MLFKKKNVAESDLNCPRCHVVMRKIKKEDVMIDVCDKCNGMWLDDGEIHKLGEMMEKNGKKP